MDTAALNDRAQAQSFPYGAFISYDHDDQPVARGIQRGLHRIGRRVGRLHALRVFRDSTDLTASPDLWGKVTEAMDRSRYLIAVLSRSAATSVWVNKEVAYWLEHRGPDQLMFVVADGQITWDEDGARFDPDRSNAALPVLTQPGVLVAEPFYVDVSQDAPWDPAAPIFREKVTDLAAPIHGKPKYELASEDMREQRKSRWVRRAAISGLVLLTVVATVAAIIAVVQRQDAIHQRNEAVALALATESRDAANSNAALALALAAESSAATPAPLWQATDALVHARLAMSRRTWQQVRAPLTGHTNWVDSVALSLDGSRMAAAGVDGTVRLWELPSGRPIGEPLSFGDVESVALNADGSLLATGGDGVVRLWELPTGQPIGEPLSSGDVESMAFSADGTRLVSGNYRKFQLWELPSGQLVGEPVSGVGIGAPATVRPGYTSVAFSPDRTRLASADADGTVRLWEVPSGRPIGEPLTGHTGYAANVTMAFSPDGTQLATAGRDATVRLWEVPSGRPGGGALFPRQSHRHILLSHGHSSARTVIPRPASGHLDEAEDHDRRRSASLLPNDAPRRIR